MSPTIGLGLLARPGVTGDWRSGLDQTLCLESERGGMGRDQRSAAHNLRVSGSAVRHVTFAIETGHSPLPGGLRAMDPEADIHDGGYELSWSMGTSASLRSLIGKPVST